MKDHFLLQIILLFFTAQSALYAQDPIQKTAEVFFPEKIVLAQNHPFFNYSVNDAFLKGMQYESIFSKTDSKEYYRTTVPLVSLMSNPMENSDAYEFEMKSAKLMGIDGFQFELRPLGGEYYLSRFKKIFAEYIKVAEVKNIDFKFSIIIDMKRNKKVPVSLLLSKTESTLNELFKMTNYSKKWLRTGDNKVILFTKTPQKVIDQGLKKKYASAFIKNPNLILELAEVYHSLQKGLIDDVAFVYQADYVSNDVLTNQILDFFPAIYTLSSAQNYDKGISGLEALCRKRNRPFIQCVVPDMQSVKPYDISTKQKLPSGVEGTIKGRGENNYVKAHNYKMTSVLRDLLEKGVKRQADLLYVTSWNYYNRGSHFAPELHHGYGMGLLLKEYKNKWLKNQATLEEEAVIVSFKNFLPGEFNKNKGMKINFRNKEKYQIQDMDSVEVVTILKEKSGVYFNNQYLGIAPKGTHAFYVEKPKGKMEVKVKRARRTILQYSVPKEIDGKQTVTDFLTYTFSNLDENYARQNHDIILNNEMRMMRNRFLISNEDEKKWRKASSERFFDNLQAMYNYGIASNKYIEIQAKNYKKFKQQIKEILTEFNYGIWLELEESALKNQGIPMWEDNQNEALRGYNILPEYSEQK
ncbi:hypothetical protein [Flammeovirga aprica]|uniref:Uncharacterized protein n=1 Tax=Flammeovirga aprica JL-4 TaxID=694437 RepID=A0A7X9XBA3_9BACT|nr:hypothetical protein [Flammeovirga aprica]NME70438.1 hypothetical protein [Flammeovirga aprica JL-4]